MNIIEADVSAPSGTDGSREVVGGASASAAGASSPVVLRRRRKDGSFALFTALIMLARLGLLKDL